MAGLQAQRAGASHIVADLTAFARATSMDSVGWIETVASGWPWEALARARLECDRWVLHGAESAVVALYLSAAHDMARDFASRSGFCSSCCLRAAEQALVEVVRHWPRPDQPWGFEAYAHGVIETEIRAAHYCTPLRAAVAATPGPATDLSAARGFPVIEACDRSDDRSSVWGLGGLCGAIDAPDSAEPTVTGHSYRLAGGVVDSVMGCIEPASSLAVHRVNELQRSWRLNPLPVRRPVWRFAAGLTSACAGVRSIVRKIWWTANNRMSPTYRQADCCIAAVVPYYELNAIERELSLTLHRVVDRAFSYCPPVRAGVLEMVGPQLLSGPASRPAMGDRHAERHHDEKHL